MPNDRASTSPPALSRRQLLQSLDVTLTVQLTSGPSSDFADNPRGSGADATDGTTERSADISEGPNGMRVRLAFLLLDESFKPISGAVIDVWQASPRGVYSRDHSVRRCTLDDPEALTSRSFRGTRATDERGRADFDTGFRGWYSGRALHIHFAICLGEAERLASQLYYDDAVSDDITQTQPINNATGMRDTMKNRMRRDGLPALRGRHRRTRPYQAFLPPLQRTLSTSVPRSPVFRRWK